MTEEIKEAKRRPTDPDKSRVNFTRGKNPIAYRLYDEKYKLHGVPIAAFVSLKMEEIAQLELSCTQLDTTAQPDTQQYAVEQVKTPVAPVFSDNDEDI